MKLTSTLARCVLACAFALSTAAPALAADKAPSGATGMSLVFRGVDYEHRWSKGNQNEFTPREQKDLSSWRDMITLNLHEAVTNGEQLAEVANRVLANYQRAGKILRTDSKPRTQTRSAEHLIVAVLGNRSFLEAVFARLLLVDGAGTVAVYSHRVYGTDAGPAMGQWLQANGPQVESALMAWDKLPTPAALKALPQSK
jgi:hypothetical protein